MRKGEGPLSDKPRLLAALSGAGWIIAIAARDLGTSREAVYKAMRRHGIARRVSRRALSQVLSEAGARGGRQKARTAA